MRVLQFIPGYKRRGAEIHVLNLMLGMRERKVPASLAVLYDDEVAREAHSLGLDVHVIRKRHRGDPSVVLRLAELVRNEGFQIVHTHLINGNFYGRLAGRLAGNCSVVSTIHNHREALPVSQEWVKSLGYRLDIAMARLSDRVISVTDGLRVRLIHDGLPENRVKMIPGCIDTNRYRTDGAEREASRKEFGISNEEFVVGTAGGLVREKRLDLLLKVAHEVLRVGVPARFLIAGEGYLAEELRELAKTLGIEEKVIFAGWRSDIPYVISAMDAFVLCSSTETTSMVIVEGMTMERPIVAMQVGDLLETFTEGVSGYFVPSGDIQKMSEALVELYRDPEKRKRMGEEGRKEALEKFSREKVVSGVLRTYEEALQARHERANRKTVQ
jgi:glycosyltransferase involved in cell wall biosynthesis